jgi:hypothetical protein
MYKLQRATKEQREKWSLLLSTVGSQKTEQEAPEELLRAHSGQDTSDVLQPWQNLTVL